MRCTQNLRYPHKNLKINPNKAKENANKSSCAFMVRFLFILLRDTVNSEQNKQIGIEHEQRAG